MASNHLAEYFYVELTYNGAESVLNPAQELGFEWAEDDHIDSEGLVDWDSVLDSATEYLKKRGIVIIYY